LPTCEPIPTTKLSRLALFGALFFLSAPAQAIAQARGASPEAFAFHRSFWLNLHHFLYAVARAEAGLDAGRSPSMRALADTVGFSSLPSSDRSTWRAAVAYYGANLAHRDILFDSGMVAINNDLAGLGSASIVAADGIEPSLAAVLERAAPIYRRLWWPRHDATNRAWEARMEALLASYGDSLAAWESHAVAEPWPTTPIRVDVTAYANWAGAYTSTVPSHITVSSADPGNQDDQGLEILFHEALHTMDDTLAAALKGAFRSRGKPMPRDATHVFIFYTAGALTRRAIPNHVPYAEKNGLWNRVAEFEHARPLLDREWQPYLAGAITFKDAIERYVSAY
jgi:hypothetical protein